ncbi:hypothetical protein BJ170DRAFT_678989 [Xylariales sp. AK1849]|nr:hypothetical protein BJ170DRAFT_678989 [Xylariales sp. AK1849]
MIGLHTRTPGKDPDSKPRPDVKRTASNVSKADILPVQHSSKANKEPRRQISNPVQRSTSHVKDQYTKANPINTSRPDRNASVKSTTAPRPGIQRGNTSFQTRYMEMLLSLDTIPRMHNIYASFFSWILLAGFVVFPGTFTSIEDLSTETDVQVVTAASTVLNSVKNVPLLVIAAVCCGVGATGMGWLAIRWRRNYVWLLNRLFLPGIMNGLAGLISALITVYTQQHGAWSVTAKVSAIVEGCCMGVSGALFVMYNQILLKRVKRKHGREMEKAQADEGFLEKAERKLNEPGMEPGSVV